MPPRPLPILLAAVAALASGSLFAQPAEDCQLSLEAPDFVAPASDGLHALPHERIAGHTFFHGQGLYGLDNLYLVHLAVFMGAPQAHPHNFQVVLEVDLEDPADQASYRADRAARPTALYTATPAHFDQTALVAGYPGRPALRSLPASSIVRGHFEQGGTQVVGSVDFEIGRVVYFREFFLGGPKLADQNYLLFGRGGEAFGSHLLSAPPDFDQMLAVEIELPGVSAEAAAAVEEALAGGLHLRLPERSNQESARLRPGSELACDLSLPGVAAPVRVIARIGDEIYCESGEFSALVMNDFNQARRCGP